MPVFGKLYRIQSDSSTETNLSLSSLELERSNKKVAVGAPSSIPALQEHSEELLTVRKNNNCSTGGGGNII